eukprot:2749263-Amphidinium_carterae.1
MSRYSSIGAAIDLASQSWDSDGVPLQRQTTRCADRESTLASSLHHQCWTNGVLGKMLRLFKMVHALHMPEPRAGWTWLTRH